MILDQSDQSIDPFTLAIAHRRRVDGAGSAIHTLKPDATNHLDWFKEVTDTTTSMKILRYVHAGVTRTGVLVDGGVQPVSWSLRDLLVLAAAGQLPMIESASTPVPLAEVGLLPPVDPNARVLCIGINYAAHQAESADVFVADIPRAPIVFAKLSSALCGANADLHLSGEASVEFDYEVELCVVIGAPARDLSVEAAQSVIAGYTVMNDISARDVQVQHVQWTLGKNTEHATPIGPWVVTADEFDPHPTFDLELTVNGAQKQSASTAQLIFDVPRLISEISRSIPLQPGDVIATGTPAGVGFKRHPPEFLTAGDEIVAVISGIGSLHNHVT